MKIIICASGRLRNSPELSLLKKYQVRSEKIGKLINFSSINILEYESAKWNKLLTNGTLLKSFSSTSFKVLLDERGKFVSSTSFAEIIRRQRDNGAQEIVFFVGGADGIPDGLSIKFDEILSFGKMVWPHFLARVMLMEQIYRTSTILAGLPYHKD